MDGQSGRRHASRDGAPTGACWIVVYALRIANDFAALAQRRAAREGAPRRAGLPLRGRIRLLLVQRFDLREQFGGELDVGAGDIFLQLVE